MKGSLIVSALFFASLTSTVFSQGNTTGTGNHLDSREKFIAAINQCNLVDDVNRNLLAEMVFSASHTGNEIVAVLEKHGCKENDLLANMSYLAIKDVGITIATSTLSFKNQSYTFEEEENIEQAKTSNRRYDKLLSDLYNFMKAKKETESQEELEKKQSELNAEVKKLKNKEMKLPENFDEFLKTIQEKYSH